MNHVWVTVINQRFNVSIMIVDSQNLRRVGQVTWGNWSWASTVSLYILPNYNRPAVVIIDPSSTTIPDSSTGTVTITNLAINNTGMFMLNVSLVSSNGQYSMQVRTYGILVKATAGKSTIINTIIKNFILFFFFYYNR